MVFSFFPRRRVQRERDEEGVVQPGRGVFSVCATGCIAAGAARRQLLFDPTSQQRQTRCVFLLSSAAGGVISFSCARLLPLYAEPNNGSRPERERKKESSCLLFKLGLIHFFVLYTIYMYQDPNPLKFSAVWFFPLCYAELTFLIKEIDSFCPILFHRAPAHKQTVEMQSYEASKWFIYLNNIISCFNCIYLYI